MKYLHFLERHVILCVISSLLCEVGEICSLLGGETAYSQEIQEERDLYLVFRDP